MTEPRDNAGGTGTRVVIVGPGEQPSESLLRCRYETLRRPLGFPTGSERLSDDVESVHAWVETVTAEPVVISVGRAHLIAADSDGGQTDHAGPGATECPGFPPLARPVVGFPRPAEMRPAFHIRQMGTLPEQRGRGYACRVLEALEERAMMVWNARTGWLQARLPAMSFYQSNGWTCFGEVYEVTGVGPHRSMWRGFAEAGPSESTSAVER